jgi:Protein of unknown function (DUF4242)
MVYVVERYLPGLSREEVEAALRGLKQTMPELESEGMRVRYLGSTIVPDDESCFCQFEASSEEAVAEANRRAGIPFARIVAGVAVDPARRVHEGR